MPLATLFRTEHPPTCPAHVRPLIDSYTQLNAGLPTRDQTLITALQHTLPADGQKAVPDFWPYAVGSACAARWLAEALDEDGDWAFAAGLWHGTGLPVLHAAWPAALARLNQVVHPLSPERHAAEHAMLGVHHGEVSAELARRWGFAEGIVAALAAIHEPRRAGRWAVLAAIVHLAAWRTRVERLGWDDAQAQASCPTGLARWLSVPFTWCSQHATLRGVSEALLGPMPPPSSLAAALMESGMKA